MTDREYDTSIAGLNMNGFGPEANPYGHEDCWMNYPQTTDVTTTSTSRPSVGLDQMTTDAKFTPAKPCPSTDQFHELACIFQRSLNTGNPEDMTTRPHKITLHMSGVDLIRLVQLAMYPTGERK